MVSETGGEGAERALVPTDGAALEALSGAEDWAEWLAGRRSPETNRAYASDLRQFAAYLLEVHRLDSLRRLTVRHVIGYPRWLLEVRGYAASSVARKMATVRSALDYLTALGYYPANPAATVKAYHVPNISPRTALTGAEARTLLEAARGRDTRDYAILLTLGTLALRRAELCKLQCGDISKREGHVVVQVRGKGGTVAYLPLPPHVQEAIRLYAEKIGRDVDDVTGLRVYGGAPLFVPTRNNRADLHAGTPDERNRKALHPDSVLRIVHKYGKLAGLTLDAHTLRHTAITMAFDRGGSLRRVQAMARHADPKTTTRYDSRAGDLADSAVYLVQY
jgi:integrase/recombinase XerD